MADGSRCNSAPRSTPRVKKWDDMVVMRALELRDIGYGERRISKTLHAEMGGAGPSENMVRQWIRSEGTDAGRSLVRRSNEQNKKMWALLKDLADQAKWLVDGEMQRLSADDWKHIVSAGARKHQRVARGFDGGFVILGQHTSQFTVEEMSFAIEIACAIGAEQGVNWTDPLALPEDWRERLKAAA